MRCSIIRYTLKNPDWSDKYQQVLAEEGVHLENCADSMSRTLETTRGNAI